MDLRVLLLFAIFASVGTTVNAQSSVSDPARVQERIEQNPEGRATETRPTEPSKLRSTEPEAPVDVSPEAAQDTRFVLAAVTFSGLTAFSPSDFSAYYEPYLATEIGTAELQAIAQNITEHYRTSGFFLSRAVVDPLLQVQKLATHRLDVVAHGLGLLHRERPQRQVLRVVGDL